MIWSFLSIQMFTVHHTMVTKRFSVNLDARTSERHILSICKTAGNENGTIHSRT